MEISNSNHPRKQAEQLALEAEKEARDRISRAHEQVKQAERESQIRLDQIQDEYVKDTQVQTQRHSDYLAHLKTKNNEIARKIHHDSQTELNRLKREAEADQTSMENHYRKTVYQTDREAEDQLHAVQAKHAIILNQEQDLGNQEIEKMRTDMSSRLLKEKAEQELAYKNFQEQNQIEFNKMQENNHTLKQQSYKNYTDDFEKNINTYQKSLKRLNTEGNKQLQTLQNDTSQKLAAYSQRAKDPFYRMVDLDTRIKETNHAFIVTAQVPKHEQEGLSVSVRGDEIVITGNRRNLEKSEVTPGHKRSTAAYQSYTESFSLGQPVDAHSLSKEFDGDTVKITVQKKPSYAEYQAFKGRKKVELAEASRPDFPKNLPLLDPAQRPKKNEPLS